MNKLLVRPTPEQSKFENANYYQLKAFADAVQIGFERTLAEQKLKPKLSMNFVWFPVAMHGNVLSEFAQRYPEMIKATGRKNHCIMLNGGCECYIKKLSDNLRPSYNFSNTTEAMVRQMALPEQTPLPIIFLGYKLTKDNSKILGVYAVCLNGNDILWVSDLLSMEPPLTGDRFSKPVSPVITPTPEIQVFPKRKKKAQ